MRVYIAASLYDREAAIAFAEQLHAAGVEVMSTWHADPSSTPEIEARLDWMARGEIAGQCAEEIDRSKALVWLYNVHPGKPPRYGAAIEAGIAIGLGKPVYTVPLTWGLESPSLMLCAGMGCAFSGPDAAIEHFESLDEVTP